MPQTTGQSLIAGYPHDESRIVLGLISGTSADGVDVAAVKFPPSGSSEPLEVLSFDTIEYPTHLRLRVLEAAQDKLTLRQTALLNTELAEFFSEVALNAMGDSDCALIASHGQTVCHLPHQRTTLQLGDGSIIANLTDRLTVTDFRPADLALGGQGAPLVPLFDKFLLASAERSRIAINLGGIANITVIPKGGGEVSAWDTGPANCISDAICRLNQRGEYDPGGQMAAGGQVDQELLTQLLSHPYFGSPPPKSTGLEDFGEKFAQESLTDKPFETLLRTSLALSAQSLVDAIVLAADNFVGHHLDLVFAGGGTANETLMGEIRARLNAIAPTLGLASLSFLRFSDFAVSEESREAVAFAFLGDRTVRGLCGSVPSTTGAERSAILGKVSFPPSYFSYLSNS